MSVLDFIRQQRQAGASWTGTISKGVVEVGDRLDSGHRDRPRHVPAQYELIGDLFDTNETVWLLFFDAGRYDIFDQLVGEYFEGSLQRCYNGGVGYTGDWTVKMLTRDFGNRGLFSWVPLRGFGAAEYDGRRWFEVAPDIQSGLAVEEQLAALGYAERSTDEQIHISPSNVNDSVRRHKDDLNGGVVRYLKPHPPFEGLPELTAESSKTAKTRAALANGELTYEELTQAYIDTYRIAFEHATELVPDLEGRVVITADHGTCLTCGQLFHGRRLEMHDHLTVVPWFEVEGLA